MSPPLANLLHSLFKIRPEEARRTGLAFTYLFAAIGAFIIGRIARSVLFLEIPNYRELLPLVYVLIAVTVSIVMAFYARFERLLRRDQTNAVTLVVLMVGTLAFRFALSGASHEAYWAFYVWVELLGGLLIVQFWTLGNEIFTSRQAKRLFAVIGGGGVIANIVLGIFTSKAVHTLGTENLLYILCLCLVLSLIAVLALGRDARPELKAARERKPTGGRQKAAAPPKVFASRHVQLIAGVIILTYLVSTLVDYQFQVIVGDSIPGKDDRSAFFGTYFAITGVLGGIVQFFLTARLLERFGVLVSLILLPLAMLSGSLGIIFVPVAYALWAAAFTKGSEVVLRYTVNDTTLQLLYLPLPGQTRSRAKAIIDGMLKPLSIGTAGIILALLVGQLDKMAGISLGFVTNVYQIGWVVAAALTLWVVTLLGLRREYLKSLVQTLQRRRLNLADATFQISDPATVQVIEKALLSARVGEVLHGLELLAHVTAKIRAPLDAKAVQLLNHESEDVRVAALRYLGAAGTHLHGGEVQKLLEDPAAQVRAQATLALCAIEEMGALGAVHHMLEDPDRKVRACAVAGLIRHGGLDGVLACADLLKRMLSSPDADDRERAAWVLGEVGVQNFYQPLIPLLADPSERVRLAAIEAAGRLKTDQLWEPLLGQLRQPRLANAAIAALAAAGPAVFDTVAGLLRDTSHPAALRAQLPKVLARLQDTRVAPLLSELLTDRESAVRTSAIQALNVLVDRTPGLRLDPTLIGAALKAESRAFFELLALAEDLQLDERAALLADAVAHRQRQVLARLLELLALKYPNETVELVARNLTSAQATTRANAVEVLDNMLVTDEKPYVIPIVEESPAERKLQFGQGIFALRRTDRQTRLGELLDTGDEWLQICAAVAIAGWRMTALLERVEALVGSPNPVARETALYVLKELDQQRLAGFVERLRADPARAVSRYAASLAG